MRFAAVMVLALLLTGCHRPAVETADLATVYDTPLDHPIVIVDGDDGETRALGSVDK